MVYLVFNSNTHSLDFILTFSSISSHYVCPSDSSPYDGEVVIMVPALDPPGQPSTASAVASTHIDVQISDMGSPKTTTESSGKVVALNPYGAHIV